jgi:hypothetical protein
MWPFSSFAFKFNLRRYIGGGWGGDNTNATNGWGGGGGGGGGGGDINGTHGWAASMDPGRSAYGGGGGGWGAPVDPSAAAYATSGSSHATGAAGTVRSPDGRPPCPTLGFGFGGRLAIGAPGYPGTDSARGGQGITLALFPADTARLIPLQLSPFLS